MSDFNSIELLRGTSAANRVTRLAWLPILLLLVAIVACWLAGLRGVYPYDSLRLGIESRPGQGSCFVLTVPIVQWVDGQAPLSAEAIRPNA